MINVGWGESDEARVSSVTELDTLLDRLSSEYRGEQAVLVELTLPSGDALSVGLGHERSVLSFVPGDGLPRTLLVGAAGRMARVLCTPTTDAGRTSTKPTS